MRSEALSVRHERASPMSPQPPGVCSACDSMWRDYAEATAEHLKLFLESYMAIARGDWELEDRLSFQITVAERRRGACREQIRKHENSEHPTEQESRPDSERPL